MLTVIALGSGLEAVVLPAEGQVLPLLCCVGPGEAGALFLPSCAAAGLQPPKWSPFPNLYKGAVWAVGASVELE